MGQYLTHTFAVTAETADSITIRLEMWYNSTLGVNDSSNSFTVTGHWPNKSESRNIMVGSGGGSAFIYSEFVTYSKAYHTTQTLSFNSSYTGINYWGASAVISDSGSFVIPIRAQEMPYEVGSPTATRINDGRVDLSWADTSTDLAGGHIVYRNFIYRSVDGAVWAGLATLEPYQTSYSDTTTSADHSYWYLIQAGNNNYSTSGASTNLVYTTPATPGTPSANKSGSNIVLSFTNYARYDGGVKIYESFNGGAFSLIATVAAADQTGYTHVAPAPGSHAYKVSAYTGALESALSAASNTVDAYVPPTAPTGVAGARTSDTSHTITWTRNPTLTGPYDSQQVQRSTDGGGWATISTVAGTDVSYTDTTTTVDHAYAWRVVAINTAGSTASGDTGTYYTTPATPGTPTTVKSGTNIILSFTNPALYDVGIKVYESQGGGAFTLLATVATANLTGYTHVSPNPATTHAYKVATYNGSLISAQSVASSTVQLQAPPVAPTGLGPSVVADATEALTLVWIHNPVDSTTQTKREIQYRTQGVGTWTATTAVTISSQFLTITPSTTWSKANNQVIEWQVRTWGAHATASPWSATATIPLSARPTATIGSPGSTVTTSRVTVNWTYYDAEGSTQSAWTVKLKNSLGAVVETKFEAGYSTSATMDTNLANGTSWTLEVQVADTPGLWSLVATKAFSVSYSLPPTPGLNATPNGALGLVNLRVVNNAPTGGEIATSYNDFYRSINGGAWQLIYTNIPLNTLVTDWAAPTRGTVTYRVVAVSGLLSNATSPDVVISITPNYWVFLSTGPHWSQVARFWANLKTKSADDRAKSLEYFEGRTDAEGYSYPVQLSGSAIASSLEVSGVLEETSSTPDELRALARSAGVFLWRDTRGRYFYCSLEGLEIEEHTPHRGLHSVSFTLRKVSVS